MHFAVSRCHWRPLSPVFSAFLPPVTVFEYEAIPMFLPKALGPRGPGNLVFQKALAESLVLFVTAPLVEA